MQKITLSSELYEVRSLGPRFIMKFSHLGVKTVKDLLWHFPSRYEDWTENSKIIDLHLGDSKTVSGTIQEIGSKRAWKRHTVIVEAIISDDTGSMRAVWFNQPYVKDKLKEGGSASFSGKVSIRNSELYLSNPRYELISDKETKYTGGLVPIYPETRGLTSKGIRATIQKIFENLETIPEFLPHEVLEENDLPEVNEALHNIHFPKNIKEADTAKKRFAFEELFLLQLNNLYQKISLAKEKAPAIKVGVPEVKEMLATLPFELTDTQKKSLSEVLQDLERSRPMNRLLQGDVGSGKTIVAGIAALVVANNGYQVALMAPTEILVRQHYKTLMKFFKGFMGGIGLLVSKEARIFYGDELETDVKKANFLKEITSGKVKIIVGTHALIEKNVEFQKLGLVIVDEQHRFGVSKRAALTRPVRSKTSRTSADTHVHPVRDDISNGTGRTSNGVKNGGVVPHFLSMSATPIPRTIMMTVFGDLDLSIISELPKGRKSIVTKIVDPENRDKAYAFIRGQVRKGRQAFVICPRIETDDSNEKIKNQNEKLSERQLAILEVKNVKEEYDKLTKKVFPDLRVAMLHGKMPASSSTKRGLASCGKSKEETMNDFTAGETDILVATSVVEVGVDVPNATIMMVEGSERFGLAQLYQFRGRVGRGVHQSFCFLFTESPTRRAHERLKSILTAKNGFELAEKDLKFRGPGEFLGKEQTGMPDIAMNALQNPGLIASARGAAESVLKKDPNLKTLPNLKAKFKKFREKVHFE